MGVGGSSGWGQGWGKVVGVDGVKKLCGWVGQ